ncbi:hypothetical protein QUA26_23755 [Microcoleus sp. Pol12A4]|uniref:hypothetical protein n=1 Tax=unclassified Microcoleus TaxID=2642155 RepID=UPI002FD43AD4
MTLPYLLDLRNQESGISKNFALPLSAFETQQQNVGERGSVWNFNRRSGTVISFASPDNLIPCKLKARGF